MAGLLAVASCSDPAAASPGETSVDAGPLMEPDIEVPAACESLQPAEKAHVSDTVANLTWTTDTGETLAVHEWCGRPIVIVETAVWCDACTDRAALYEEWLRFYEAHGMRVILVVGEDEGGNPATSAEGPSYRAKLTAAPHVDVVTDPRWHHLREAIDHGKGGFAGGDGTIVLPFFAVLDPQMRLAYLGNGGGDANFQDVAGVLAELTGETFRSSSGCSSYCGGLAAEGCWCGTVCQQFGDCCEDNCSACGNCP